VNATGHVDTFVRDRLPPPEDWPELLFTVPEVRYPPRLNAASELLRRGAAAGGWARPCLGDGERMLTYGEVRERVHRLARVLADDLGLVPGHRVLLRGYNGPMLAVAWLAVLAAGGIAVTTMPLLRRLELAKIVERAAVDHALCDVRLLEELAACREATGRPAHILTWGDGGLERRMAAVADDFRPVDTAADDPAIVAFTSGTTGQPKGCVHFHRDLLAVCDTYARHVLAPTPEDRFTGTPPLGFTYGLGGMLLFPLAFGAASVMAEALPPERLPAFLETSGATVLFTAPTAYRAMLRDMTRVPDWRLRLCVSAGETLPAATFEAWRARTGLTIVDGIGSTEMLHIFISAPPEEARPGVTGRPVPGYVAEVVDDDFRPCPPGVPGRLVVKGPTGCRYLDDPRQREYVRRGWNVTGDTYVRDAEGRFAYVARSDDIIVSAGYNIAGPEVEAALLTHPAVAECGVVGAPDPDRGQVVAAYVVLAPGHAPSEDLVRALQDHVKRTIAPYKYPRRIRFLEALPRTQTGKLQRFRLRELARTEAEA